MSYSSQQSAKVTSLDALARFREELLSFCSLGKSAIGEAERELDRTMQWLERDQATYWKGQYNKRKQKLAEANEALRKKQLYRGPSGTKSSAVFEQKAVKQAKAAVEEAELKLKNIKRWYQELKRQGMLFRGQAQGAMSQFENDLPQAATRLERMMAALTDYLRLHMQTDRAASSASDEERSMRMAQMSAASVDELIAEMKQKQADLDELNELNESNESNASDASQESSS